MAPSPTTTTFARSEAICTRTLPPNPFRTPQQRRPGDSRAPRSPKIALCREGPVAKGTAAARIGERQSDPRPGERLDRSESASTLGWSGTPSRRTPRPPRQIAGFPLAPEMAMVTDSFRRQDPRQDRRRDCRSHSDRCPLPPEPRRNLKRCGFQAFLEAPSPAPVHSSAKVRSRMSSSVRFAASASVSTPLGGRPRLRFQRPAPSGSAQARPRARMPVCPWPDARRSRLRTCAYPTPPPQTPRWSWSFTEW